MEPTAKSRFFIFWALAFLAAGFGLGFVVWGPILNLDRLAAEKKGCSSHYAFVNPEPDCDTLVATISRLQKAQADASAQIDLMLRDGKAKRISVFSRDLKTFRYVSVNEQDAYEPASLLKVPLMVAYDKLSEVEPDALSKSVTIGDQDLNGAEELANADPMLLSKPGQSYTVENLIERMIKYSDNNATDALYKNIDPAFLERVLMDLGIRIPKQNSMENRDFVNTKSFAAIFRMLYNSSYLSRDLSEKALRLMSQTTFAKGARSVLPDTVIEKYGERSVFDQTGALLNRELNECGIVYPKSGPYTFCIFTEGGNYIDLVGVIQTLSKTLYTDETNGGGNG